MEKQLLVWIFQTGEPLPVDAGNVRPMRAMNLGNSLIKRGHKVVLWSARFNHSDKSFRELTDPVKQVSENLQIRLIDSSGYQKNIGLGRLLDHALLAVNLGKLLSRESDTPDVAFVGYPPIETACVFTNWLRKKNVPVMLDVKDQWPLIFVTALPGLLRPVGKLLFWPYFHYARKVMQQATAISAMAEGFLDWSLSFSGRKRTDNDRVFPLTTPTGQVNAAELTAACQWWDQMGVYDDDSCRLYFVGSFSQAFDFTPVRVAAQTALRNGDKIQFVLCGDGGALDDVRVMMEGLANVIFPGWIDRPRMESLANRCTASIAPYRNLPDFMLSVPNKIIDSLSLGLPILSPLRGEIETLFREHEVGIQYDADGDEGDNSLYRALKTLLQDKDLRSVMSGNARELYNARFSFEQVYGSLVTHLEQLAICSNEIDRS